jgi:hypothetical protein
MKLIKSRNPSHEFSIAEVNVNENTAQDLQMKISGDQRFHGDLHQIGNFQKIYRDDPIAERGSTTGKSRM